MLYLDFIKILTQNKDVIPAWWVKDSANQHPLTQHSAHAATSCFVSHPSLHPRVHLLSDGNRLFRRACSVRTRGNGFKLKMSGFRLNRRKELFTVRVVKHCHRFPKEVLDSPSLETLKVRLDGAPQNNWMLNFKTKLFYNFVIIMIYHYIITISIILTH